MREIEVYWDLDLTLFDTERYMEDLEEVDPEYEIHTFIRELSMRELRKRLRQLSARLKDANSELRENILVEFSQLSRQLHSHQKQVKISNSTKMLQEDIPNK